MLNINFAKSVDAPQCNSSCNAIYYSRLILFCFWKQVCEDQKKSSHREPPLMQMRGACRAGYSTFLQLLHGPFRASVVIFACAESCEDPAPS